MAHVPVEDRLEIQELVARYAFRCDTKAYDRIGELFTENGIWDESVIGMPYCEGSATIHQFFCGMAEADLEYIIHINSNHQILEFESGRASGTTHLYAEGEFNRFPVRILGYYSDEYLKVDSTWLMNKRTLIEITPSIGFTAAQDGAATHQGLSS